MAYDSLQHAVAQSHDSENVGTLKAFTRVPVTDIYGNSRYGRVSLGVAHCVTLDQAKDMVHSARQANQNIDVFASVTINL